MNQSETDTTDVLADDEKGYVVKNEVIDTCSHSSVRIADSYGDICHDEGSEERRLVAKLDRRILPIVCFLYLFAYLDRSNLGNARLQGLPQDALRGDPTGVLFDWVTSAFYFTYIPVQVPATVLSKLFRPRLWLGASAIAWGICSTLMSTGFNFPGLIATRLALGVFEAGFGPGIPLYMSYFYTKSELGLRMAYFIGFAAVSGAFGGLIAFGVQHIEAVVAKWRLLFIIEGIPAILLGVVALFFLPDRPETTMFLSPRERECAVARMRREMTGGAGMFVNRAHVWSALRDWKVYCAGAIYFCLNCALTSISAFLPTIIKTFGFSTALAQLLTVPPYAVATIILCGASYWSDRVQSRGLFMVGASLGGCVGYLLLLLVSENQHARYFATFCITTGTYTTIGIILAWFSHNLASESKRATGIPLLMAIGQFGSILGSHIFPATEGPRYMKGFAISCALEFLAATLALALTIFYRHENRRRNRSYGEVKSGTVVNVADLADDARDFRYVT